MYDWKSKGRLDFKSKCWIWRSWTLEAKLCLKEKKNVKRKYVLPSAVEEYWGHKNIL